MSEKRKIEWKSDRIDHYLLASLENLKMDFMKMAIENLSYIDLDKTNLSESIKYNNYIVPGDFPGMPSDVSVGATAILMCSFGQFPVPKEILDYVMYALETGAINERNLPNNEDIYETGREMVMTLMKKGFNYYSACAIAGATFVESHWNVHAANMMELNNGGVGGTGGWSGCGEGLFGLTFWRQKDAIMKKLLLPGLVNVSKAEYEKARHKHLCDCTEEEWVDILKTFLEISAINHHEILTNEDVPEDDETRTQILCSSYLFKAAPGLSSKFDNVKTVTENYMRTHIRLSHNKNYQAYNGFAFQIYVSMLLDKYINNGVFDENDLYDFEFDNNIRSNSQKDESYEKMNGGTVSKDILDDELFKRSSKIWDIKKACQFINDNAKMSSTHYCAKAVRQAIEAGGINTAKRPNIAWKYIYYLPTIGFKHIKTVKKNDPSYVPEPGDIAVYMKNNNPDVPGHICMWTGKSWCSDFKQRNMIVYRGTNEAEIFRFV